MEGKKPKILLCEDDTNLGMVLKNYLELNDFDVTLESVMDVWDWLPSNANI